MTSSSFVEPYLGIKKRIENKLNFEKNEKNRSNEHWEIIVVLLCSNNKGRSCFCFEVVRTNELERNFNWNSDKSQIAKDKSNLTSANISCTWQFQLEEVTTCKLKKTLSI